MKSTRFSILIGLFLVFEFFKTSAVSIDSTTQNEINRRLHVEGAMGGNITLTSNSSIGIGSYGFVLSGETNNRTSVAIKIMPIKKLKSYNQEYHCYEKMNATMNKVCEKYGIPFIYHSGDFLEYKTMAMTMLDIELFSFNSKIGGFSLNSILIIIRDMIKTIKFVHSKRIAHKDIHLANIMTKGANVFLIDFNFCTPKNVSTHSDWDTTDPLVYHDMLWFLSAMSILFDTPMYCNVDNILQNYDKINEKKRKMKEELLPKIKYTELVEPFVELYFEVAEAKHDERLPKYDHFYKMFDDLLYAGRNRSERIVFDWLTPAEKATAMAESILPIESIVFPEENVY